MDLSRFGALRSYLHRLNLPARALGCGAAVLAVNAALPVIYRHLHESKVGTKPTEGAAYDFNHWTWLVLLPATIALANLFPKPRASNPGEPCSQRRWLPMTFFIFWLAATVTHLYSLDYVYDFDLHREWVAPAVLALAWTAFARITDFIEFPRWQLNRALLCLPAFAPFVAGVADNKTTFALAAINTLGFGALTAFGTQNRMARNLAFGSALTMVAALPQAWGAWLIPGFTSTKAIAFAILAGLVIPALLSRNPKLGFLGAIAAGLGVGVSITPTIQGSNWAIQAGLVFFLLHSLRWDDSREKGLPALRNFIGGCWVLHTFGWAHLGGPWIGFVALGLLVIGAWLLALKLGWVRGLWAMGTMAGFVVVSSPLDVVGRWVVAAPAGLLAVVGSFALFALGTATALAKHHRHKPTTMELE